MITPLMLQQSSRSCIMMSQLECHLVAKSRDGISSSLIRDWTGCGFGFVMLKYWCKIKPMIRVIVSGEVPFGEKSIET